MPSRNGHLFTATVSALLFFASGCCPLFCPDPGPKPPPQPSTPTLSVVLGFGAAGGNSAPCSGEGTVTARSATRQANPQTYRFSGYSGLTAPVCRTSVQFNDVNAGQWTVQDSTSGTACAVTVSEGLAEQRIRIDAGSCGW